MVSSGIRPHDASSSAASALGSWLAEKICALPILELKFSDGAVSYRWKVDEPKFVMPVRVGKKDNWQIIQPTSTWQTMKTPLKKDEFAAATDLYFVEVSQS